MATWTDIKTTKYDGSVGSYNVGLSVTLQYDADSITPTSVTLRFKGSKSSTYYGTDMYYVLVNPGNTSGNEKMFLVKGNNVAPTTTDSFKVSKTYTAETFPIPTYWICHMGQVKPVYDSSEKRWYATFYNDQTGKNQTKTVYTWFASGDWWYNSRMNYKTVVSSTSKTIASSSTVGTAVTAPTAPTITDNYNNTFTITGYAGKAGKNNPVKSTTLYYRLGDSGAYTKASGLSVAKKSITVDAAIATQNIYAYTVVSGTYNNVNSTVTKVAVKNYQPPSLPGKPELSYKKSRLTIKEPWTFTWTAATKTNNSSPVKGYRIRIFKNGLKNGLTGVKQGSVPNIVYDAKVTDDHVDRDGTSRTVKINPTDFDFKPGDTVQLGIYAYTRKGKNNDGSNSGLFSEKQVYSTEKTVQNAGVARIKVDGKWIEGQVYVKVEGKWKEAESVQTKVKGSWKESE